VPDVGLLRELLAASKHDEQGLVALDVLHAPPGAEVLAHFEYTLAQGLNIAQVAELGLAQSLAEPLPGQGILQPLDPA
jgi:hypothetical protein